MYACLCLSYCEFNQFNVHSSCCFSVVPLSLRWRVQQFLQGIVGPPSLQFKIQKKKSKVQLRVKINIIGSNQNTDLPPDLQNKSKTRARQPKKKEQKKKVRKVV